jgi:ABC-type Zn uptake system ZnuABC Zn-binding protein ZnuA
MLSLYRDLKKAFGYFFQRYNMMQLAREGVVARFLAEVLAGFVDFVVC